jgi:hypothetical protein
MKGVEKFLKATINIFAAIDSRRCLPTGRITGMTKRDIYEILSKPI